MDCVTCGYELVGTKLEVIAAICSENHMLCSKCNQKYMCICPLCESDALYCDILPFDDNSITLFIDLQRQRPEMQQSAHDSINIDASEEEVIEEHVLDDGDDDEGEEEGAKAYTYPDETQSSAEENDNYKKMFCAADSVIVSKARIEKQHAAHTYVEEEEDDSEDDPSELSSLASSDSNIDQCVSDINLQESKMDSDIFKAITENPVKPSKFQVKIKNKSLVTQFKLLCADAFIDKSPKEQKYNSDWKFDQSLTERKVPSLDLSSLSRTSKSSKQSTGTVCMDGNGVSKCIPQRTYTYKYDRLLESIKGCSTASAINAANEDGERLFIWRSVKKGNFTYNTMFVKTAPKGDERMQALFEILREHQMIKNNKEAAKFFFDASENESN